MDTDLQIQQGCPIFSNSLIKGEGTVGGGASWRRQVGGVFSTGGWRRPVVGGFSTGGWRQPLGGDLHKIKIFYLPLKLHTSGLIEFEYNIYSFQAQRKFRDKF